MRRRRSSTVLGAVLGILAMLLVSIPAIAAENVGNVGQWFQNIEIGLTGTGIVQGVSQKRAIRYVFDPVTTNYTLQSEKMYDRNYATYSIDFEVNADIAKTGHAYMLVEAGNGLGPDQYYNVFGTLNEDAIGNQGLEVSELWYQQNILGGMFKFKIGKVDLTDNFDTNNVADDEETQFLAGIFVNNPTIEFPDYCFGATLWAEPTKLISIGLAYGDADADWNQVLDYPFLMAEVDIHPQLLGLEGNYRFMAWRNGNLHRTWEEVAKKLLYNEDTSLKEHANFGFAISADQKILPELTLFARWGWQDPDIVSKDIYYGDLTSESLGTIENAISAGFQLDGAYWGRDKDHLAFAYGWNILNGYYRDYIRFEGLTPRDEHHFELYYHLAINDYVNVCPDVQFVMNPQGVKENHNMLVVGVRGQVKF